MINEFKWLFLFDFVNLLYKTFLAIQNINFILQSREYQEPQWCLLPGAWAVLCSRQPSMVLHTKSLSWSHEQNVTPNPIGPRNSGGQVPHTARVCCHVLTLFMTLALCDLSLVKYRVQLWRLWTLINKVVPINNPR